jgi:hypothetical protein
MVHHGRAYGSPIWHDHAGPNVKAAKVTPSAWRNAAGKPAAKIVDGD